MKSLENEQAHFLTQEQVSLPIILSLTFPAVRTSVIVAIEAVILGIALQWLFGKGGAQLVNRPQAVAIGFALLVLFILAFVIVANLFPPEVRVSEEEVAIGSEYKRSIAMKDIIHFSLINRQKWTTCRIVHTGKKSKNESFEFHIASTPQATVKLDALALIFQSAGINQSSGNQEA